MRYNVDREGPPKRAHASPKIVATGGNLMFLGGKYGFDFESCFAKIPREKMGWKLKNSDRIPR